MPTFGGTALQSYNNFVNRLAFLSFKYCMSGQKILGGIKMC